MRVSIYGLGYVGSVCAGCLSRDGHQVVGVDISRHKVDTILAGASPVSEPGLTELIQASIRDGRLRATTCGQQGVAESDISLICVGTPSNGNGSLHLDHVVSVCRDIGAAIAEKHSYHVVVVRSTVLPGTVRNQLIPILEQSSGKRAGVGFGVCMNPEFLREGTAIKDYDQTSQIVIGEIDQRSGDAVQELFSSVQAPVVRTALETAEMVKYANNALHATKIAFANEIGNVAKACGVDGREVMEIVCADRKLNISTTYLKPGFAFGGSCLPKDLRAILHAAQGYDLDTPMLRALLKSNQLQVARGIRIVERTGRRKVGILGLSFKAGTDDVRESPIVPLAETLLGRGFEVCIYDRNVEPEKLIGKNKAFLERELPHIASLMCDSIADVVRKSEVVVIGNGSPEFQNVSHLIEKGQVLIDLVGASKVNGELKGNYEGICW